MINLDKYPTRSREITRALRIVNLGKVKIKKGEGYFYIYSEDPELALKIAGLYTSSINVARLDHLTLRQWIYEIEELMSDSMRGYVSQD